jgi:O-antigen/teichoic acid export membrane protein
MSASSHQSARAQSLGATAEVSLRRRFVSGVSWNTLGTVFAQGSVFIANIVIARQLGAQLFGEFSLLQHTALTFAAIAQVATGATATRYVAEHRSSDPARAGRIIGACAAFTVLTGLAAGAVLLLLSGWLGAQVLNAPQLSAGLKIMAAYLLFSAMSGFQTGVLAGLEGYRRIAQLGAVSGVVHIALSTAGVWLYGLPGALWALVGSIAVRWWLHHIAIRKEAERLVIRISYVLGQAERAVLLKFSVPAALASLTAMPALWLANAFLVQQPDGYLQAAYYYVAFNFKLAVLLLPIAVNGVGASIINNQIHAEDRSRYRHAYWWNVAATTLSALSGAALVVLLSDLLLALFGPQFVNARGPLTILMAASVLEAAAISLYQIVQTRERMWWSLAAVSVPRDGLIVAAAFLLAPAYGAFGIALAYLLGWALALAVIAATAYRLGITPIGLGGAIRRP